MAQLSADRLSQVRAQHVFSTPSNVGTLWARPGVGQTGKVFL